jgi:hypothetical protein
VAPTRREKTILFPSGDQLGPPPQPMKVVLERRPPQPGTGICRSPLPSECITQIVLAYWDSGTWAENRISFPCGDQLPVQKSKFIPGGVICRSRLDKLFR